MADIWPDDLATDLAAAGDEGLVFKRRNGRRARAIWGSPAGKSDLANRLVKWFPSHDTYVEPFAGSAVVFFAKEPSRREVLSDFDADIAAAFAAVKGLSKGSLARLRSMDWTSHPRTFKRLKASKPSGPLAKLHRFLYLSKFSFSRGRTSYDTTSRGKVTQVVRQLEKLAPRLADVIVRSGDWEPVVREFDGPGTFYFLDPPYVGTNNGVGESKFDEARFAEWLDKSHGRWMLTYGTKGKLPGMLRDMDGVAIRRVMTDRAIRHLRGSGPSKIVTIVATKGYEPTAKAEGLLRADGYEVARWPGVGDLYDWLGSSPPVAKEDISDGITVEGRIFKAEERPGEDGGDPKRIVWGVVLEPETPDTQGDIYSADEVEKACHGFMRKFGIGKSGPGLQHQQRLKLGSSVNIVECGIEKADLTVGDTTIKAGAWTMGMEVLSDALWGAVQRGELTGFSIGGSAMRKPLEGDQA